MKIVSKIRQYYRYRRNWKKLQSRHSRPDREKESTEQAHFYSQLIGENDLCFDIGANVGDKTDTFLKLGAKVVAVEPQESCWRILKHRFKNNNVYIETSALAGEKGTKTLFVDRSTTLSTISQDWLATVKQSGRFPNHKWAYNLTVPATTLDYLVEKYGRPAFCKIDVEGFEYDVLKGLSEPIKTISLEFVSERIDASLKCVDYLSSLGKVAFNYCLDDSASFALPDWVDCHQIKTVLTKMEKDINNYGDLYARFDTI